MKRKAKKFSARNRVKIDYAPEAAASKPLTANELAKLKRVDVDKILTEKQKTAISEFATKRTRGRPKKEKPKMNATIRLDSDLLEHLRETGAGWQVRLNDALKALVHQGKL